MQVFKIIARERTSSPSFLGVSTGWAETGAGSRVMAAGISGSLHSKGKSNLRRYEATIKLTLYDWKQT